MRFEFATSHRILFGPGTVGDIGPLAVAFGRRPLLVTGSDPSRAEPVIEKLKRSGIQPTLCGVAHEPTTDDITPLLALCRASSCDQVIGLGGGAALDAAKAVAALATNDGELLDHLEVIGKSRPLEQVGLPCIAIPTTAGTGSEVTRNAVLASPRHRVKVSLRSPHLLPRLALVDPTLTHSLPPPVTATTGLDALTQLIEPYTSGRANPMTDALCVDGIRRAARSLRRAFADGADAAAREDMALASLFGGMALANAGLGAVHGFAGPIGGMFDAPHGAVCAALLPGVMEANLAALKARAPEHPAIGRYDEIARLVTGNLHASAADGIRWVRTLVNDLKIPTLAAHKIGQADFAAIVEASAKASSMKANAIGLTNGELTSILEQAV